MGNATTAGLAKLGIRFADVHRDATKMADLAASSVDLFGYEAAVVPFDLCVEAEALGCEMNAYNDVATLLYPTIKQKAIHSPEDLRNFEVPQDLLERGRVPVVREALRQLRNSIGGHAAIGTYVLGPFTLAGQLMELDQLFVMSLSDRPLIQGFLQKLTTVIVDLATSFREAGADFVTVREMGAATDILNPRDFQSLIQPLLVDIAARLAPPRILHICGSTNKIVGMMAECGYDAISVEPKNDLRATRATIGPEVLVFGNLDAYKMLVQSTPDQVEEAVREALAAGVDAIWPSCDIWPEAKLENLQAMVESTRQLGTQLWQRRQA